MFHTLRRAFRQRLGWRRPTAAADQATIDLLTDVGRLPAEQHPELARGVAALWAAFGARFGGPQGFIAAGGEDRLAYHRQLADFVARFVGLGGTDREHVVMGAALMLQYTSLIGRADLSASERNLSALVAEMITRGSPAAIVPEATATRRPSSANAGEPVARAAAPGPPQLPTAAAAAVPEVPASGMT